MRDRKRHPVKCADHMFAEDPTFLEDRVWAFWRDRFSRMEIARMRFDGQNHFYPHTKWAYIDKNKEEN